MIIQIGKLSENAFDKHIFIVIKNKENFIEGYQGPMNRLWGFPIHDPYQINRQSNMIAHNTIKHWCQHIKTMAPWNPREILTNIPTRISHVLSSDTLMPNKMHPAQGNK